MNVAKRMAAKMPRRLQQELKRAWFAYQVDHGDFSSEEPEYNRLDSWVESGNWVIDVGANVGHYTLRMSMLAGGNGRVIAFEPVPDTFELLSANCARAPHRNISLLNAAASDSTAVHGMEVPKFHTGLDNYYMARIAEGADRLAVLSLAIDSLRLPHSVSLAKIDAEGHDYQVLKGMHELLRRDHPVLIVEEQSDRILRYLHTLGYCQQRLEGSHNAVFTQDDESK